MPYVDRYGQFFGDRQLRFWQRPNPAILGLFSTKGPTIIQVTWGVQKCLKKYGLCCASNGHNLIETWALKVPYP